VTVTGAGRATFDLTERQQAFVGLLTTPLVTPTATPELHRLVIRHRAGLAQWATRLGYRLVSVGAVHRLRRLPVAGEVAAPAGPHPSRRELVLALLVASCLEDVTGDTVTIQGLSDAARDAAAEGHTAYDPERHAERRTLVRALGLLTRFGVLERRTAREELVREWEDRGTGPGAGFRIDRDALVLLVDPADSRQARLPADDEVEDEVDDGTVLRDSRSERLLRVLVETQGLLLADLSPEDRDYWRSQRQLLLRRATEMTGGTAELRAEGAVLVLPPDGPWSKDATVNFPSATADSWVALALLDATASHCRAAVGGSNVVVWASGAVDAEAEALHERLGDRLTAALRVGPEAIRAAAERELADAGLIRVTPDGDWQVLPYAGRYRDAVLHSHPAEAAPDLTFEVRGG